MCEPEFYHKRKTQIDAKLELISKMDNQQLRRYFEAEYERHKNVHNPVVNWDNQKLTKQRLSTILGCMGATVLSMFLEKLSHDFKQWSFGMPDLILWRENKLENKGQVKFVEVKSELDTLSEQQKCWIAMITRMGVQVDLCQITDSVEGVDVF